MKLLLVRRLVHAWRIVRAAVSFRLVGVTIGVTIGMASGGAIAGGSAAAPARVPDESKAGKARSVPLLPAYQQECAACHAAYPPGLLPASSWQRLMNNLTQHFGTDASLEAAASRVIGDWLQAHAADAAHGRGSRRGAAAPPQDRITRSAWFLREHDEIGAAVWQRPGVRSASNCAACHPRADQGDFNEHHVRIPR